MNTSQIGPAPRSWRPAPPPQAPAEPTPRFSGPVAVLASLESQLRRVEAGDGEAEARLSAALARALAVQGIETREVLRLGERAFSLGADGALASELSSWWAGIGEPGRAAAILQRVAGRASPDDRGALWTRIGVLLARAGKGEEAAQAFEMAMQSAPTDPLPAELLGMLHGWGAINGERAAQAFQEAAERRLARDDEAGAFENWVRAFEACPSDSTAAERLAHALEQRSRPGAAEEVLKEHARCGSGAHRAAVHQRRFQRHIAQGDLFAALGAALDAELDAAFDLEHLDEIVTQAARGAQAKDVESLFVRFADEDRAAAAWLLAALDAGVFAWGNKTVQGLHTRLVERLQSEDHHQPPAFTLSEAEIHRRSATLREQLLRLGDASQRGVRLELARLQAALGAWRAAHDALQPLLLIEEEATLEVACLAAVVSVRAAHGESRARALAHIARHAQGRFRAVISAVAAEHLLEADLLPEARAAAERAVQADASWQGAVAAQALVAQRDPDAAAAALLERSLAVLLARSQACRVLAESSERRGALRLALTWTQRQLSQRPGELDVMKALLRRAAAAGDGERLADALSWLLSQPVPIAELAATVAESLEALMKLSREQAPEVARRVLDVMGHRAEIVREAVLQVARSCQLPELECQVLERSLVTAPAETRVDTLLELARLRAKVGDVTAAARALRRALATGARPSVVLERLEALPESDSSDAIVARLATRAEALLSLRDETEGQEQASAQRVDALREWGAACWDLVNDARGAIDIWARALEEPDEKGPERFATDVAVVAGAEGAVAELERVAGGLSSPGIAGRLLGSAARAALEAQSPDDAFRLACAALERHPANADVLTIAERAASNRDISELVQLYQTLAAVTLGNYGERAVHYRAARQLEKRGQYDAALQHAIAAFEAVPAEGVAFVLMARLADRAGASDQVVAALERVASRAERDEERVLWLERAAALADTSDSGRRQRIDVLLRALAVRPDAATLGTLTEAIRQLLAVCPEEADILHLRFERALNVLLPKAGGMDGAQFAVRAAEVSLRLFESEELALRALRRAAECDCEIEQYADLHPYAERLTQPRDAAKEFVRWCVERAGRRVVSLGRGLAELSAKMAAHLGDREAQARLVARAAVESPEDADLVRQAQRLARELGDSELLAMVEEILPSDDRARAILIQAAGQGVDEALDLLLDVELEPLSSEVRRLVLEALASRQEEIGRLDDAEGSWRALLHLQADNVAALAGLERAAERRGDAEELARLLSRRAECVSDSEQALEIRVKRAKVLEQRLGRVEEARQELERLLAERGDRAELLQTLAELHARGGSPSRAATLWGRASTLCHAPEKKAEYALLAAEAHLQAGEIEAARRLSDSITLSSPPLGLLELRVNIARQSSDRKRLVDGLVNLADRLTEDVERSAKLFIEAAQIAEELSDPDRALELAVRAADLVPDSPEAQLLARRLEYMARGAGTSEQAARTIEQLRNLGDRLSHRQIELRAFLMAEALDVAEGGGAGRRELDRAVERVGSRALVAVGLAERLEDDPRRALQLLDAALGSDLHGLRGEGQVLIRAGRVARALQELDRAQAYLSAVAHDDPRQLEAAAELREIAAARSEAQAKREARERAEREEREARERAQREAREKEEREAREARERAEREARERQARERAEREARERAEREARERQAQEQAQREAREKEEREARERAEREAREARERAEREAREQAEREERERAESKATDAAERTASGEAPPAPEIAVRSRTQPSLDQSGVPFLVSNVAERETELRAAFEEGDVASGRALFELLERDGSRSRDALLIAERLAVLAPGDEWALRRLVKAAEADRSDALAAAARHVLGTFGVVPFEVAPEVSKLREQPDEVRRILLNQLSNPGAEATALVWENIPHLFKQEPSAYGITGVERLVPGPLTPLSRLYADASRLLGATRTPIFQRRGSNAITLAVALLSPPALLVSGEIEDSSTELAFHFGAMLMATSPEFALLFGAEPDKVRTLLEALVISFGPPVKERAAGEATRLAAVLWESIAPRAQRRLTQLCSEPEHLAYEKVTARARQVLRRAGFVVCADLATAVVAACEEERLAPPRTLGELGECCRRSAAVADLLRLALSPEYAEVRWNAAER